MRNGNIYAFILGCVVGLLLGAVLEPRYLSGGSISGTVTVVRTDTIRDTVSHVRLVALRDTVVRHVKEKPIFIHDTVNVLSNAENLYTTGDSVVVPISQKEYTDDSTYRAWVSGYQPSLDSIFVYRRNIVREQTFVPTGKALGAGRGRVGFGLVGGAGYGLVHRQADVFVGGAVYFRIWP